VDFSIVVDGEEIPMRVDGISGRTATKAGAR
jgi:hypothetical protein